MAYIGQGLDSDIQVNKYEYTATAGQTIFACTYDRAVDVYVNGVKLDSSDFTASNGTSITLASGANAGDIVDINAYFDVTYANFYTQAEADARFMDINEETLPTQTGQSGKFLTTNGTAASWIDVPPEITKSDTAPSSPSNGDFWYDTNDFAFKFYDGSDWQLIKSAFSATGGVVTDLGGYRYHTFTSSGTFQVTKGSNDIEYIVVAGGGGGGGGATNGNDGGGGGGAGGLVFGSQTVSANSWTITVGGGGSGGGTQANGTSGANTSAFGITSIAGGFGGLPNTTGGNGGSGGGSGGGGSTAGNGASSGTAGQGNAGAGKQSSYPYTGSGGGGKTSAGESGNLSPSTGNGGDGFLFGPLYYAGGGGGGEGVNSSSVMTGQYGLGGSGVGGDGGHETNGAPAQHGSTNTGSGGGGGAARTYRNGGNGASGVVVIRYPI